MSTFLDILKSVFALGVGAIGRVVGAMFLAIGCLTGFLLQSARLNLTAEPGIYFLALIAWFLLWVGSVFFNTGKAAKAMVTVSLVCLSLITIRHYMPGTAAGASEVAHYQDFRNYVRAKEAVTEIAVPFTCNATNWRSIRFFGRDGNTGAAVVLVWFDVTDDGHIDCYRTPGVDPIFGRELKPMTASMVRQITTQDVPAPAPVTVAVAPPEPPPVPSPSPATTEVAWSEPVTPPRQ